ncbi:hypothetical protein ACM66B_001402 [Microbotryomycetes sp. NB124-2]
MPQANFLQANLALPIFSRQWDPQTEMPDLTGKVAVVTGGNTGIGYHTVAELLRHGCKVYMACRSEQRARDAIEKLSLEVPDSASKVVFLKFDLTELHTAKSAAKAFNEKESRLDIVICNAGIMAWPYEIKGGVEIQFYNHLGHFALVQELLPILKETAKKPDSRVRVVNVSSAGHKLTAKPDFSSLDTVNAQLMSTWHRYGQSKLSNILFTNALQKRVDADGIKCLSLHPGVVHSELLRGSVESYGIFGRIGNFLSGLLAMSPYSGAKTQLYAATSPEVDELNLKAAYLTPIASVMTPSAYAQDAELAEQLWSLSERAVSELTK